MKKKHIGSSLDSYLRKEGIEKEVTATADKRVRARVRKKRKKDVDLTRDFSETIRARAARDPAFRKELKREEKRRFREPTKL